MSKKLIDFAYDVIEMQDRITRLEMENEQLLWFKEEYHKLVESSNQHNMAMMGNIMQLVLTPGVVEACQANNTFSE